MVVTEQASRNSNGEHKAASNAGTRDEAKRALLKHAVHHTAHMLSEQGPMNITFVHNNTLLGLQTKHFHDAIAEAQRVLGLSGYESVAYFQEAFARGRICEADLDESLAMQPGFESNAVIASFAGHAITAGAAMKAVMRHSVLESQPLAEIRTVFAPERGLLNLGPESEEARAVLARQGKDAIDRELSSVGRAKTLGECLGDHFGIDIIGAVGDYIEHNASAGRDANAQRAMRAMAIPASLRETYCERAKSLWGEAWAKGVAFESQLVAQVAQQKLGCPGRLADISKVLQACPEGFAARDIWTSSAKALDVTADVNLNVITGDLPSELGDKSFELDFEDACAGTATELFHGLSGGKTISDVIDRLAGTEVTQKVNSAMIRICAAFTDEGLAAWRMPERHLGLFRSWRKMAESDLSFDIAGLRRWREELARLPEDPLDALIWQLEEIGIPESDWEAYTGRSLAQLPGWAGMMFWLETHPDHYKQKVQSADTIQYLAVRLFHERLMSNQIAQNYFYCDARVRELKSWAAWSNAELLLRLFVNDGSADPHVTEQCAQFMDHGPLSAADRSRLVACAKMQYVYSRRNAKTEERVNRITRLYRLAAHLGIKPSVLTNGTGKPARDLLKVVEGWSGAFISRAWLEAFEVHYRDEVLNALSQNKSRGRWLNRKDKRPRSQVVFCIDEREENLHRYYAELDPEHETLGAAGFFGIAISHSALGEHDITPLCPAVATPGHRVAEIPREKSLETVWPIAKSRSEKLHVGEVVMWEAKRNAVTSFIMIQLSGVLNAVPLLGRIFTPLRYTGAASAVKEAIVPPVPSRLTHLRMSDDELTRYGIDASSLPFGFTVQEAADRLQTQLCNWGLTYQFAPIVVICAHRSYSVNNPHENAHDCGACGGKAGGPNARLFAALANEPAVRTELATRGINIPDDTWFVGGEHNTANDEILCFDLEDIPQAMQSAWQLVAGDLEETSRRAARERCRRFRSAPKDASTKRSWQHVKTRSQDLSQVRPEWGHATNAFALVGRRAVTQGLFFDRRGFVISYDPTQDPDGTILERILMAVGPVGAGINLEYYFSTVNPDGYGSGTKVPHNVVGMVGVMPGAHGDLATGLPRQMTEVHEAMRLQLIVDSPMSILGEIYGRQPAIQELLDGQWVHLIAHDPETGAFNRFVPGTGFVLWDKPLVPLPEVPDSYTWIRGKHDCFLPPARILEPAERWTNHQH